MRKAQSNSKTSVLESSDSVSSPRHVYFFCFGLKFRSKIRYFWVQSPSQAIPECPQNIQDIDIDFKRLPQNSYLSEIWKWCECEIESDYNYLFILNKSTHCVVGLLIKLSLREIGQDYCMSLMRGKWIENHFMCAWTDETDIEPKQIKHNICFAQFLVWF